jgi:hypothetical protein
VAHDGEHVVATDDEQLYSIATPLADPVGRVPLRAGSQPATLECLAGGCTLMREGGASFSRALGPFEPIGPMLEEQPRVAVIRGDGKGLAEFFYGALGRTEDGGKTWAPLPWPDARWMARESARVQRVFAHEGTPAIAFTRRSRVGNLQLVFVGGSEKRCAAPERCSYFRKLGKLTKAKGWSESTLPFAGMTPTAWLDELAGKGRRLLLDGDHQAWVTFDGSYSRLDAAQMAWRSGKPCTPTPPSPGWLHMGYTHSTLIKMLIHSPMPRATSQAPRRAKTPGQRAA